MTIYEIMEAAHANCTSCSICGAGGYWEDDNG